MFGLSPTKILFTIAVVVIVWYGFKMLGRYQKIQKERQKNMTKSGGSSSKKPQNANDAEYEELVKCKVCDDFVVADKKSGCGREACPYER